MEETFVGKIVHAVVFLAICAGITSAGWSEPLSYRFKSAAEIQLLKEAKRPPAPPADVPVSSENWHRGGTALDHSPYRTSRGTVKYSKDFDPRKMGPSTETDRREKTVGKH